MYVKKFPAKQLILFLIILRIVDESQDYELMHLQLVSVRDRFTLLVTCYDSNKKHNLEN